MIAVTASPVTLIHRDPLMTVGAQLRMDDGNYVYMTPEVAAQWLPVLTDIATNETSNNA